MDWDALIQLCNKHELYPLEVAEMIYAYIHEDQDDQELAQEILDWFGDGK